MANPFKCKKVGVSTNLFEGIYFLMPSFSMRAR